MSGWRLPDPSWSLTSMVGPHFTLYSHISAEIAPELFLLAVTLLEQVIFVSKTCLFCFVLLSWVKVCQVSCCLIFFTSFHTFSLPPFCFYIHLCLVIYPAPNWPHLCALPSCLALSDVWSSLIIHTSMEVFWFYMSCTSVNDVFFCLSL